MKRAELRLILEHYLSENGITDLLMDVKAVVKNRVDELRDPAIKQRYARTMRDLDSIVRRHTRSHPEE